MTDRERLTNIIHNAQNKYLNLLEFESSILADYLLANGVIIPVRCMDCEYYQPINSIGTQGICNCGEMEMNYGGEFYPLYTDFCSYGELKKCEGK